MRFRRKEETLREVAITAVCPLVYKSLLGCGRPFTVRKFVYELVECPYCGLWFQFKTTAPIRELTKGGENDDHHHQLARTSEGDDA